MLEKSIKRFRDNVLEIEHVIAQDANATKLQALDDSLCQIFLEIKHFDANSDHLKRVQIEFFLDYIAGLAENDLISTLVGDTKELVDRYIGDARPSTANVEDSYSADAERDAAQ